jgi:hypothetical protein
MNKAAPALLAIAFLGAASNGFDLLQNALDPNPTLKSYVASAQLQVTLHRVVPLHKTFIGTDDYNRPDEKLVFDNATGVLSRFRELTTTLPSKAELQRDYRITSSDDGSRSQFVANRISPEGRVRTITFTVSDTTRLLLGVLWSYSDGSSLFISPTYQIVGAYKLPAREEIRARFKGYSADGSLTLSNYRISTP